MPVNIFFLVYFLIPGILVSGSEYREKFFDEGMTADKKYNRLPKSFTEDYLAWVPDGYNLQVLPE